MNPDPVRSRVMLRGRRLQALYREILRTLELDLALCPDSTEYPARLEVRFPDGSPWLVIRARPDGSSWWFVDSMGNRISPCDDPQLAVWEIRARLRSANGRWSIS